MTSPPPARSGHALAYDAARQRVVLFGGYGGAVYLSDTWEWDGTTWLPRTPVTSPPARRSHALAYDAARQRVVLFGGYSNSSDTLSDTWEWDGTTWLPRAPVTSPPGRDGHALAYDAARQRVVLFGGYDGSAVFSDTWEWDGTTWLPSHASDVSVSVGREAATPSPTTRPASASSSSGGSGDGGYLSDTWEWDGTTWLPRMPVTSPPGRCGHALAYDAARQRVVLFGGCGSGGHALGHLGVGRDDVVASRASDVSAGAQRPRPRLRRGPPARRPLRGERQRRPFLGHLALPPVTFLWCPSMRLQHLLVLGVVTLALSGCRGCQPRVTQVEPAKLSLDATQLDFPATYVGSTATLAVQVLNSGKASGSAELLTAEPFSSGTATLLVAGGTAEDVRVTFAPTSPGVVTGTLTVGELSVELHGEGLAIPECTTANPCETSAFELHRGRLRGAVAR